MPSAPSLPAYSQLLLEESGRAVWVVTSFPGEGETVLERITMAGVKDRTVRMARDLLVLDLRDGRLVGVAQDRERGDETLEVYTLRATSPR